MAFISHSTFIFCFNVIELGEFTVSFTGFDCWKQLVAREMKVRQEPRAYFLKTEVQY